MKRFQLMTMLTFTGILLALSCEKDKPVPTLPYDQVFGSWDWYSTTTGWGVTTYADSVAYNQSLNVTRQGGYIWKQNDTITRDEKFSVDLDTIEGKEVFMFEFGDNGRVDQSFYIKEKDTLYLTDACADCDSYIFVRQ